MTYIRFEDHKFSLDPPQAYHDLIIDYTSDTQLVEDTWYLDKPVSRTYRDPESKFVEKLRDVFYVYVADDDGSIDGRVAVYFSRLPELAEMTADLDTAAEGILFGFPARDVASYIEREGGDVS